MVFELEDTLNLMYKEMIAYIKSCGLRIFPAVSGEYSLAEELSNVMIWNSKISDWKSFIEVAKDEGLKQ